jgi:hypothetical protein
MAQVPCPAHDETLDMPHRSLLWWRNTK